MPMTTVSGQLLPVSRLESEFGSTNFLVKIAAATPWDSNKVLSGTEAHPSVDAEGESVTPDLAMLFRRLDPIASRMRCQKRGEILRLATVDTRAQLAESESRISHICETCEHLRGGYARAKRSSSPAASIALAWDATLSSRTTS